MLNLYNAEMIWWPNVKQSTIKPRLNRVHRMECIGIAGVMSSMSTAYRVENTGHWKYLARATPVLTTFIIEEDGNPVMMPSDCNMVP